MANLQPLKYLVVSPKAQHTATVIFLHGLGDTGAGWESAARYMQRDPALDHVKWVLPHARINPVTLNFGMSMPSWYDIYSLNGIGEKEDEAGMLESAHAVNQIITAEVDAGIDASRIILGGFSQGGAVTLFTGLTTERQLAGLAVLSSYIPIRSKLRAMLSDHAKKLPIFMGHGTADGVVAFKYGQGSVEYMKNELGIPGVEAGKTSGPGIRFESYEGLDHGADPSELEHLKEWLADVIPSKL